MLDKFVREVDLLAWFVSVFPLFSNPTDLKMEAVNELP
jgi:hypothetical protein